MSTPAAAAGSPVSAGGVSPQIKVEPTPDASRPLFNSQVQESTALADEFAPNFTYGFLKGVDTLSTHRPKKIDIPASDLGKMGNMERQYWDIKAPHFDVVVFFKKGKFYELYDCDAVISSREFGLKLTYDTTNRGKMRMTGVPEQSFAEWARLFVFRGYKVGRVEQMEVDPNVKAKVVPRDLVQILTPGTVTDAAMLTADEAYFVLAFAPAEGRIDAVAIDGTRNIFLSCPCQGRSEDELWASVTSLLIHLAPKEIVFPSDAEAAMQDMFARLRTVITGYASTNSVAVEPIDFKASLKIKHERAAVRTIQAYFQYLKVSQYDLSFSGDNVVEFKAHLSEASPTEQPVQSEMSLITRETRCIGGGMVLDAASTANLELVANLKDGSAKHSLLSHLCCCLTGGGRRLFRRWLLRPLTDVTLIEARQAAVKCIVDKSLSIVWSPAGPFEGDEDVEATPSSPTSRKRKAEAPAKRFANMFGVDIERNLASLIEIEKQDARIAFVDPLVLYDKQLTTLLATIDAFTEACAWAKSFQNALRMRSLDASSVPLLHELLRSIVAAEAPLQNIVGMFDIAHARSEGRVIPSRGTAPAYDDAVDTLESLQSKFEGKMKSYRAANFNNDKAVQFCDIGKDLFLFEVPVKYSKTVKSDLPHFTERTRTTKVVKYCDTSLTNDVETYRKADQAKGNALVAVLKSLAGNFNREFSVFFTAAQSLAYLDCIFSLAATAEQPDMCFPELRPSSDKASLNTRGVYHPTLSNMAGHRAVANDVSLCEDESSGRVLLLTGPNMAGKSTIMRSVAVSVLMAQLGGPVCAESAVLDGTFDRIFTRIGARDATHLGHSTLFVELTEASLLATHATSRSLCLIDELGRGTSTHDGYAIAHATLQHIVGGEHRPVAIFSTHYHSLAHDVAESKAGIQLGYMDFALSRGVGGVDEISFLYKLVAGVCNRSYGVEVALKAGIDQAIVTHARTRSQGFSARTELQGLIGTIKPLI